MSPCGMACLRRRRSVGAQPMPMRASSGALARCMGVRRTVLLLAMLAAGATGAAGCGTTTHDQVSRSAARAAHLALERAGVAEMGPMSCARISNRGPRSLWRCTADAGAGAEVRCDVSYLKQKAQVQRATCGGALADPGQLRSSNRATQSGGWASQV